MNLTANRNQQLIEFRKTPIVYGLITVWVLAMISLPVFKWVVGESAIIWGVNITTLLQASATVFILGQAWGLKRTAYAVATVMVMTWGIEAIGTATGFPFGHYDYTDVLQPQLLNVPLLIAIAWLMMLPSAWAVAYVLADRAFNLRFVLFTGLAMTAWDFFLDPQMVGWDLWRWDAINGFSYFGIPWINFIGWFATAAIVTVVVRPKDLPIRPLLTIYIIVWILQTIGQGIFWGQVGPAIVGFLCMGTLIILTINKIRVTHG